MTAITTLDDLGARRFPWCPTPAPLTPRSRLLGVTWAGNLLVGCFVLGFGTWSTFAPLQSAAIAIGAVEFGVEPGRLFSISRAASSGRFWSRTAMLCAPVKH